MSASRETHALPTRDGACPTSIFVPTQRDAKGPFAAVLFCMDGFGVRPTLFEMCERIAGLGLIVALPDLFHRSPPNDPAALPELMKDPARRAQWFKDYFAKATDLENLRQDMGAVLAHLDTRADFDRARGVATTGYCMGGNISLRTAALFPERIVAAASFHGGMLVGDGPDSPHRLADKIKARVYVAGAAEDSSFTDAHKATLIDSLRQAGVDAVVESYAGRHGFAIAGHAAFHAESADRHWTALTTLLRETVLTERLPR